ncbi:MAG: PSD1 and planctomycete cytochrome C domain-containing protein [Verrucomicrobiota bacterium]
MNRRLMTCWLLAFFPATLIPGQEGRIDFNRDIRPILSENCFYCHGQDANKRKADLRLDEEASVLKAGAVVAGNPADSLIWQRIRSHDPDEIMPPPDSNRKLTDDQKALIRRWIDGGGRYADHWAFVRPERPTEPGVRRLRWPKNAIDRFVLAGLEREGLSPAPEADRATLVKRLSVDLTGLPPTPSEVKAFVSDPDEDAYEKLVDRLMESDHYGERMALPWLDAARYADSNGFQQDGDTWQWMWRDWVVKSLNEDLPFDQFTTWQLAGDLLPEATVEQKIASGFNRNHLLNGEGGAIPEEQRFVILFDRIDTTATTWLGLTMACAQCHDHKYDPITQKDYFSLMDAFNRVPESGTPQRQSARIRVAKPFLELPTAENKERIADFEKQIETAAGQVRRFQEGAFAGWKAGVLAQRQPESSGLPEELVRLLKKPAKERSKSENEQLEQGLKSHFDKQVLTGLIGNLPAKKEEDRLKRDLSNYKGDQIPRPMIMSDAQKRDTHVLDRGAYLSPLEKVVFRTPGFLPPMDSDSPKNRLGLAHWLLSPDQPLTARVQVNRMWQHFFGMGIVKTSEDFGVQSEFPVHGELLDWLAVEFRESGWRMKALNRLIVTSATYRQSSRMDRTHRERDPENRLYSRASRFRMPSMLLRDWALASSGLLVDTIGGAPVYPYQPDDIWEALAITKERDFTYPASSGRDLYRRSLYTFWRRTVQPANMFDASSRQACRVRMSTNNTPLHALVTLNDRTWVEAARVLAERALTKHQDLDAQIDFAFRRVLCRHPEKMDRELLRRSYSKQKDLYAADREGVAELLTIGQFKRNEALDAVEHAAMTAVCLALFNFDEALTRE